ncbi:NUDIX hydrolase [Bythopirellula polymerisocia]|uniref:NUDIX domain protein n=1 Tax=Bythopirellula polymerisocia TaxID=2528003 RepID=A0A5C6CZP2_9BACT|nr:NUDIX domain-containing protein [Bythopirellula polymerisocia]TWU30112.1 NUDIX domain protein [Bythopirellula polymerisocia]
MHRRPLLELLDRYTARYPDETEVVARIRHFVESSPDCFERTCRPGHITGSAWILSHDGQKCLLVHHAKLDRWLQPGGHSDGETAVEDVALREACEETGLNSLVLPHTKGELVPLDLDVHLIPARYDAAGNLIEDAHEHHDVRFLLLAEANQQITVSEESHDVGWFTHGEVSQLTEEESVLRMLRKAGPFD